jgi:glycosyltransferase involved in cell wall biosynthesis
MTREPIRVLELRSVRGTGGGPEKTILSGAAIASPHCAVTVCYVRDRRDDTFRIDEWARQIGVDYVEVHERHSFDPRAWRDVLTLIRERDIHIVHAHDYKTDLMAMAAGRRTKAIPFATAHGWTGQSFRERWVYYPWDRRLLARFQRVVAVSSQIRQELIASGATPEAVTVLLNGIDPLAFRRDASRVQKVRAALGLEPHHVVIGSVGRLERQKRFDLLLDAVADLAARHPAVRVVVVGDGSLRAELVEHARRVGIADRCLWTGHRTDVAELHHAFDIFAQSSEYEGTPNAVLEAMAMETPVVATAAGGTDEIIRTGVDGLVVPVHDTAALIGALEAALRDPNTRRKRASSARTRVEQDLSFASRVRRLERLYGELMTAGVSHERPTREGARA